jgi:hypothetical protein
MKIQCIPDPSRVLSFDRISERDHPEKILQDPGGAGSPQSMHDLRSNTWSLLENV